MCTDCGVSIITLLAVQGYLISVREQAYEQATPSATSNEQAGAPAAAAAAAGKQRAAANADQPRGGVAAATAGGAPARATRLAGEVVVGQQQPQQGVRATLQNVSGLNRYG